MMCFRFLGGGSWALDTTPALIKDAVDITEDMPATNAASSSFSIWTPTNIDIAETKVKTPEAIRLEPTLADSFSSENLEGYVT